jgi:hypothetical protein
MRAIFFLVKSLGDLPNVLYVLSFDREAVVEALQKGLESVEPDFLEKIIQVPLKLPPPWQAEIRKLFFDRLKCNHWRSRVASLCRQMPDHPAFEGLIIEIDAADVVRNLDLAKAVARQLRFSNIAISIDDLGSEWPSLVGLRDFPFVEVKVDRQFIAGCADDRLRQTVCRQILDLADGFGARTVAEGVETRADFFTVREMGFDLVQGFLFAKPMTAQKFALTTLRHPVTMP